LAWIIKINYTKTFLVCINFKELKIILYFFTWEISNKTYYYILYYYIFIFSLLNLYLTTSIKYTQIFPKKNKILKGFFWIRFIIMLCTMNSSLLALNYYLFIISLSNFLELLVTKNLLVNIMYLYLTFILSKS
jgi:hypothetical protein